MNAYHARHLAALAATDRAILSVDRQFGEYAGDILAAARGRTYGDIVRRVSPLVSVLGEHLVSIIRPEFERLTPRLHDAAWAALADDLPVPLVEAKGLHGLPYLLNRFGRLPAITAEQAKAILNTPIAGRVWTQRLAQDVPIRVRRRLLEIVATGAARGDKPSEIRDAILPLLNGVKARANTLIRTELLRIAHATQQRVWDQVEDLIAGYQIQGIMDDRIRPLHAMRSGQIWWTVPGMGDLKAADRPVLPDAPNCRCGWSVIYTADIARPGLRVPEWTRERPLGVAVSP